MKGYFQVREGGRIHKEERGFVTVSKREGHCHILVILLTTGDRVVGTIYGPQIAITK